MTDIDKLTTPELVTLANEVRDTDPALEQELLEQAARVFNGSWRSLDKDG